MASAQSSRKYQTEKGRRGKLSLVNRADKVAMIGAKVLLIVELNGNAHPILAEHFQVKRNV
jgi:hypothetical protein